MKKLMKLLGIGLICLSCGQEKPEPLDTAFQFTECGAFYKGKPLPFGKPIAEWEKIFGESSRRVLKTKFIWDDIGIVALAENNLDGKDDRVSTMLIFFSNLDSPAGEKGELKFAQGRKSTDEILKQYTEKEMIETGVKNRVMERNRLGGSSGPDKYIYPLHYLRSIGYHRRSRSSCRDVSKGAEQKP